MSLSESPGKTVLVNGQEIYFEIRGTGEPLLLLHGFSGTSQDWIPSLDKWGDGFQFIIPDLRGHGRSGILKNHFRHEDAAQDLLALLDHLKISACKAVGISAGGNALLHMATKRPECIRAMVLVSATPYFPPEAREILKRYAETVPEDQVEILRHHHPSGEEQVQALIASITAFADSRDDLNFAPADLAGIRARTMIVQGDRDPLYPAALSFEMYRTIPASSLWILPNAGHGPVIGAKWPEFIAASTAFLKA